METASTYHDLIQRNVDDYWRGRIDYDTFDKRARELWGNIEAAGLDSGVLELIRLEMYGQ